MLEELLSYSEIVREKSVADKQAKENNAMISGPFVC